MLRIAEGDPTSPRKGRGEVKFGKLTRYPLQITIRAFSERGAV